jgi:hypothetical protein
LGGGGVERTGGEGKILTAAEEAEEPELKIRLVGPCSKASLLDVACKEKRDPGEDRLRILRPRELDGKGKG